MCAELLERCSQTVMWRLNVAVLLRHGAIKPLLTIATYGSDGAKLKALAALDLLSLNNPAAHAAISEAGGMKLLQGMTHKPHVHRAAACPPPQHAPRLEYSTPSRCAPTGAALVHHRAATFWRLFAAGGHRGAPSGVGIARVDDCRCRHGQPCATGAPGARVAHGCKESPDTAMLA